MVGPLAKDLHPLDLSNLLAGVEMLRACAGTVHDGVAAVELERVVQCRQPFLLELVTAVCQPPAKDAQ